MVCLDVTFGNFCCLSPITQDYINVVERKKDLCYNGGVNFERTERQHYV